MGQRTVILSVADASCVIGNLFVCLEPPCDEMPEDRLILCGSTFSGMDGALTVKQSGSSCVCEFTGCLEDLNAALEKPCLERTCGGG